jgi:hypothetical protein
VGHLEKHLLRGTVSLEAERHFLILVLGVCQFFGTGPGMGLWITMSFLRNCQQILAALSEKCRMAGLASTSLLPVQAHLKELELGLGGNSVQGSRRGHTSAWHKNTA